MSNTPRIDAVLRGIGSEFVRQDIEILINFAKTIERENAGLKVKFERAGHEKRNHEVKLADALDEIKGLRQLVNDCHIVAGQLETERNEARAEIEILKNQLEDESMRADGMTTAHAEAGADSYRMRELIEQMRGALELMLEGAMHDFHYVCQHRDNCLCWSCQKARIKAALAAERGE